MTDVTLKTEYSTPNPDEAAVVAARGDHMEESLIDDEGVDAALSGISAAEEDDGRRERLQKFIEQMLHRGHFGPFEHPKAFFAVEGISRDQMAQVTRHRHMSFDVQSMRYVDFSEAEIEVPEEAEGVAIDVNELDEDKVTKLSGDWIMMNHHEEAIERYEELVEKGLDKDHARKVLPIGTKVNMTFSANLRSLMHVFDLRVSGAAQDDTRGFAEQVLEETRKWAPLTIGEYEEHVKGKSLNSP